MSSLQTILNVLMITECYFTAHLLYFRKQVHSIMKKEGNDLSEKVDDFSDYKSIYL